MPRFVRLSARKAGIPSRCALQPNGDVLCQALGPLATGRLPHSPGIHARSNSDKLVVGKIDRATGFKDHAVCPRDVSDTFQCAK